MNAGARRLGTGVLVAVALTAGAGTAEAAKKPTVLIITAAEGKRASLAKVADRRLTVAARREGLKPVVVRSRKALTEQRIERAAAVVLAAGRGNVLTPAQEDALNRRVRAGAGVVVLGTSTMSQPASDDFATLVGGEVTQLDAPKAAETQWVDKLHPATARLPRRWTITQPWATLKRNNTGRVHVVGWVDEKSYTPGEGLAMGVEHPVTWCRDLGEGRAFTSTLGMTKDLWSSIPFRRMIGGAMAYAAGTRPGDCGATVWSNWKRTVIDGDITDGTQLDVGPDGRVYYIEHLGSSLKIYDPKADIVKEAGLIPSLPGLGQGLLGLAIDPGFERNRWFYAYYHLEGPIGRLSRFTLRKDDTVDLLSEKVLLRIENVGIDHNGGGLAMGQDGVLLLGIGANDMPHFDGQYGSRGASTPLISQILQTNSERTTQNTDSLIGKVLRIKPEPDGTYSIPKGNMFPPGTPGTRPEIWTMGHRNAYHLKIDDLTGDVLEGDVGPDAVDDDPARGPKGYDELNLIKGPANYGWPFCIGPRLPYLDKDSITGNGTGKPFDCDNIVNPTSPGLKELGPSSDPWIWYPYGVGEDFPELSEAWNGGTDGGRLAIPGPKYRVFEGSQMPAFFDDQWFIADWTRNWLKTVVEDEQGRPMRIQRFAPDRGVQAPMDMDLGEDGSLYVLEWGAQTIPVGNPAAAKVVRYQYSPRCGTCDPTLDLATGGGPAIGVTGNVIAGPLGQTTGFLTTNVSMTAGTTLTFTNLDVVAHNVASKDVTEDGRRLFAAPNVGTGTTAIEGTDKLKKGSYDFLCTVHPSMVGKLEVQ